jgi:ABC-2 type transport system ATP-binding protein
LLELDEWTGFGRGLIVGEMNSSPAISVRGLRKKFADVTAVDGIDLEVARGECVGLLGPNGAGKTTTIEILEGIQLPTSGEVEVLGMRYATHGAEIRRRIGIQLQETRLYEKFSVEEIVRTFRSFYDRKKDVEEVLAIVGLTEKRGAWFEKLSGGQKQRVALACALVGDPELVFLDEPSTGLDPAARRSVWEIVTRLKEQGRTVLITTHYMEEAEILCDRIVIVNKGKIIAEGTPKQLIAELGAAEIIDIETAPAIERAELADVAGVVAVAPLGDPNSGGLRLTVAEVRSTLPALLERVAARGATLQRLGVRHASLDDVFLKHAGTTLEGAETIGSEP